MRRFVVIALSVVLITLPVVGALAADSGQTGTAQTGSTGQDMNPWPRFCTAWQ